MKQRKRKRCIVFWGGILTAAVLSGCGVGEQEKTIVLPPLEKQVMDSEKFRFDHIQQYIGSGYAENVISLAWGDVGTDMLCLVKKEDGRYVYQVIDTREDTVLSSVFVDGRSLANVLIAPGGGYLSYEVQDGEEMALAVLCPSQGTRHILHRWREQEENFSYIWSDDGTMLFSWQNGDSGDTYKEWQVTRYEMETEPEDGFGYTGGSFQMKGNGPAWRNVCPNADGTEIYVREQIGTFDNTMSYNWLLLPDTATMETLPEYSKTPACPVRYTQAGLFVQEESGDVYLIKDIRSKPVKTKLISGSAGTYDPFVCVCANGDHMFLMEWVNYSMYQISGVRIVDGKVDGQPVVLYNDNYESMNGIKIVSDQAVVFLGEEFLENNGYRYKVTVLRY